MIAHRTPQPPDYHVYCGQTAGWIKMPLGTEVNLGAGDAVLDGVAAPPKKGTAPSFRFMSCGQTAGWMKTPVGTKVDLGPGHIVLDRVPPPRERGTAVHVYCGHGRLSQLLLSCCMKMSM